MNVLLRNVLFSGLFLTVLSGCSSIPPEAPELSTELGKRISAIEDANIILLHRFFDQKRDDLDRFIEDEWIPEFANTFFSNRKISRAWDTIVRENNKRERLRFIVKTGPKLQAEINKRRLELVRPLDDLERRIENNLRKEYAQARAINNSITSFLVSASDVAKNRERYLEMAGVSASKTGEVIDKTDDAVSSLLKGSKDAEDRINIIKEYLEKLKEIRDSL